MQTDARLIKDIQRAYKRTSEGRHKIDSLTLTSGKRIGGSIKRKIAKSHIFNIFQTRDDLLDCLVGNLVLLLGQLDITEEIKHRRHVHAQQFMDILSSDLDIERLLTEPASAAFAADGLAGISVKHVLVLDLVPV